MWRAREVYGLCVPQIYIETAKKTSHVFPVHGIRNVQTELKRGVHPFSLNILASSPVPLFPARVSLRGIKRDWGRGYEHPCISHVAGSGSLWFVRAIDLYWMVFPREEMEGGGEEACLHVNPTNVQFSNNRLLAPPCIKAPLSGQSSSSPLSCTGMQGMTQGSRSTLKTYLYPFSVSNI